MITHQSVKPILTPRPRSRTPPTNDDSSIFKEKTKPAKNTAKQKVTTGVNNAQPKQKQLPLFQTQHDTVLSLLNTPRYKELLKYVAE